MPQLGPPIPPWQRSSPLAAGSRPALSLDLIVSTALRLLDEGGMDGLSMRKVADALGTGAASLYAYVASKEELVGHVLDRVIGELEVPAPDPERWSEQVKDGVRSMRRVLASHRDLARFAMARIPTGGNAIVRRWRASWPSCGPAGCRTRPRPTRRTSCRCTRPPVAFEDSLWAERFGSMEPEDHAPFIEQLRATSRACPRTSSRT